MPDPVIAGLGLGANIGDSVATIARALDLVEARGIGRIVAVSSLWRTPPWGDVVQPDFRNACALVETRLAPHDLLRALKRIEADLGRTPAKRWGPRQIDMDILFHGEETCDDPDLTLPHRDMFHRAFVLAPLAEIAGDRIIGVTRVADALAQANCAGLEVIYKGAAWRRAGRGE